MKKTTYLQPIIKVVAFTIESGFGPSQVGAERAFSDRLLRGNDYATGERFTDVTDDGGEFSIGRWE